MQAYCIIPASNAAFIAQERALRIKHLLFVSGASKAVYWTSNFLWDILTFTPPIVINTVIYLSTASKTTLGDGHFLAILVSKFYAPYYIFFYTLLFVAMVLYPLTATMQTYVFSMAFRGYSNVTGILFFILFGPLSLYANIRFS